MKPAALVASVLLAASFAGSAAAATTTTWAAQPAAARRDIARAEDSRQWADGRLRGYLTHRDASVRARAALAVGRLQDSSTVGAVTPLLADADPRVRLEAAFALGEIGHASARAALEAALGDRDANVRPRVLEALGKLGDRAATPRVVALLGDPSPAMRGEAAVALWRLADTSAVEALIARCADGDAGVRWRAVYALEKLPLPARIVPVAAGLLRDRDALVRAHAARTLGRLKSRAAMPALLGAMDDLDAAVIVNAIRGLQGVADSSSAECLPKLRFRLDHHDPYVRVTAATALGDAFPWLAASAADAKRTWETIEHHLDDADPATRGACARALTARLGLAGYTRAGRLLADDVVYVRTALLEGFRAMPEALVKQRPQLVADVLGASLDPQLPRLQRMTAAEIAGQLGGRWSLEPLRPLLDTLRAGLDDRDVLWAAACAGALGDWGDRASVGRLSKAYARRGQDAEPDARLAIREALRQLAGAAYADSVEKAAWTTTSLPTHDAAFDAPPDVRTATITTSAGVMEWEFFGDDAPQTVKNFARLARARYFDGQLFHRVVPDFVIQDGDPTGTGSGGPGWTIRCEYNRRRYDAGMVGMALSGKDTGGSQWFVTLSPQPHLDGRYTIFARVTRGLDVARRITQGTRIVKVEVRR